MLILGKGKKKLASAKLSESCTNCNAPGVVTFMVYQSYGHLFWIPTISLGKKYRSVCSICKDEKEYKELPNDIGLKSYELQTDSVRRPKWVWSGLYIGIILISLLAYDLRQDDIKETALLSKPQKGDVYDVKLNQRYSLCKVESVSSDSVYLRYSTYRVEKMLKLFSLRIKGDSIYNGELKSVAKEELLNMKEARIILGASR